MLSRPEQRIWDDVQRFWAAEAEEPPRAASPAPDHLPEAGVTRPGRYRPRMGAVALLAGPSWPAAGRTTSPGAGRDDDAPEASDPPGQPRSGERRQR